MKSNLQKTVIILTGLPFRKKGNQSLIRFVNMFLKKNIKVVMFSAGVDENGENAIEDSLFSFYKVRSLEISFTLLLNKLVIRVKKNKVRADNYFNQIKSEDIIPPYGSYNLSNMLNKWAKFIFDVIDNLVLILYLLIKHGRRIREAQIIVGYEDNYTIAAKAISVLFKKKYINKFQGTILKATNRNKLQAIKYFPHNYFTLNKSDLCLMVNDGTDGKYYAEEKGCKNIFFEPHGVLHYEHNNDYNNIVDKLRREGKFVLFNNASGSTWKRTDRIIRGLSQLDKDILENVVLVTTYYASNREELIDYTKQKGLENNVIFVEKIDPYESNYIIQKSDVVIMTNDFSNLGNPVLEAIYYKTPVISIDDGSLDGFVRNEFDGLLIKLDKDFDKNMAMAIGRLCKDRKFYNGLKNNMNSNSQVKELTEQQKREFNAIEKLL